jgi:hypothetical protein
MTDPVRHLILRANAAFLILAGRRFASAGFRGCVLRAARASGPVMLRS